LEQYISIINEKCEKEMKNTRFQEKNKSISLGNTNIKQDELTIPGFNNYSTILQNKYNVQQLKSIAKHFKLKISGNKNELLSRIYTFLNLSNRIIKIQKLFRGHMNRQFIRCHGPAVFKRSICTNTSDFLTIDELTDLSFSQFFSYTDVDGFTYGFNIISLYNLILKSGKSVKNPYNRNDIPEIVVKNIRQLIRLSKILKIQVDINIQDVNLEISNEKSHDLRILDVFQSIDSLGNYSDASWFLSLNRIQLIKFMRELIDIWNYRAQLTIETKKKICPPYGDPFRNTNIISIQQEQTVKNIQKFILPFLEKLVNSGVDTDSKSLGAYYVLGALTLVNENAATSLPWLFQSVSYF
ncbi:MAG: SAP domain-containing protein, partial [Cyclobacteriaceae bacterium]|nr:SAP domain-containing protein [Cyclobacteriaceae bacterium]